MAADEETIVIKVNAAQGEAALKALGAAGIKAGKDLETVATTGGAGVSSITDKYAALGAKLFALTKIAGAAGAAFKEVAVATGNYNEGTKEAIDNTVNFASALGSLDFAGAAASLGQLLGQLEAWGDEVNKHPVILGNATLANEKLREAMRAVLGVSNELIASHAKETETLNTKSAALVRIVGQQQAEGEVQKFVRDEIQSTLDAYTKTGEVVPAEFAKVASSLGIVSKAQQDAAASALELEQAGVKSAEERAKAEAKAADEVVAALEKERVALDAKLAQDQARLAAALAKGGPLDTSEDTSEAKAELSGLRQEIKKLENEPLISVDQLNNLNEMKDRAGSLTQEVNALNKVFTVTNDNWLNEADAATAAAAAQDVYLDMLNQSQARHNAVMDATDDAAAAMDGYSDSSGDAAEALGEVADAAGKIGDEAKKGADKAGEGIDKLKEGLTEALPLAEQLRSVLQDIVAIAASADI